MAFDFAGLERLKTSQPYELEDFFHKNPQSHPNRLIAAEDNDAINALLNEGIIQGHKSYGGYEPPLFKAVYKGETSKSLELFLNHKKTDLNHPDDKGYTALHWAVLLQNHKAIELLTSSNRVDLNAKTHEKGTALTLAALKSDVQAVNILLKSKKYTLKDAQEAIVFAESDEIYHRLLRYTDYARTIEGLQKPQQAKKEYEISEYYNPLHLAIVNEDPKKVAELLKEATKYDDPVFKGPSPLHRPLTQKNINGYTPLDYAIATDNKEIIALILKHIWSSSQNKITQKVDTCKELVLYRAPREPSVNLADRWSLLNRAIEKLTSKSEILPGVEKTSTLVLPFIPPAKRKAAPPAINGSKLDAAHLGDADRNASKPGLKIKPTGLPPEKLQIVPYRKLNGNGTLALYSAKKLDITAALKKGAEKAAWFTCSTAYYALGIIPVLAVATKLFFVAQGYFGSDELHEDCLLASEDNRFSFDFLSAAPQSYVDCMATGI